MIICVAILFGFLHTAAASIPTLAHVANKIAYLDWNANHAQLWTDLKGDELAVSAVATRNAEHIQAAMLLAGKVMAIGVSLPVNDNGLSTLCEIVTRDDSLREEFFSDDGFETKKREYLGNREQFVHDHRLELQHELELFPFMNLLYVCGSGVPLSVKVYTIKASTLSRTIATRNALDMHDTLVTTTNPLKLSFQQLLRTSLDERSALLLSVEHGLFPPSAISTWLRTVIPEMLADSEFFRTNSRGQFELVHLKDASFTEGYYVIGELLGLGIIHNVAVPRSLDKRLLRSLIMPETSQRSPKKLTHVQHLRTGFYNVIPSYAIVGNFAEPANFINEQELSNIFSRKY